MLLARREMQSWRLLPRIIASLEIYPCNLLFIHRDAEREPYEKRI